MKQLNAGEDDMRAFMLQHHNFSSIRKLEVQETLEQGDKLKAIKLLEESKAIDCNSRHRIEDISKQLIDLYSEAGQSDKYRDELLFQLMNFNQTDLTYYRELKECIVSDDEWRTDGGH